MNRNALSAEQKKLLAEERDALFRKLLKRDGLALPQPEYLFAKSIGRKWRFDYAWPDAKVALEVEGAVYTNGRHTRGTGFVEDMSKYNAAAVLGWRLLRTTPTRLTDLLTVKMIHEALTRE